MIYVMGYLRVSSDGQIEGDGYPRQQKNIEEFCAHRAWMIQAFFKDATQGANEMKDRIGLANLMETLRSVEADRKIIVVEAQHRWARDSMIGELLLRDCKKEHVEVWSANTNTNLCEDGADGAAKFIRSIMGAMDEFDKQRLVYRMRVARERKKAQSNGREGVEGPPPYGARPGELKVLHKIFDLDKQAWSSRMIARELNDTNLMTRTGTPWCNGTVYKIIKNPRSRRLAEL